MSIITPNYINKVNLPSLPVRQQAGLPISVPSFTPYTPLETPPLMQKALSAKIVKQEEPLQRKVPIGELLQSMADLKKTMLETFQTDPQKQKTLIQQHIQKAHELCKQGIDLSSLTLLDFSRYMGLCSDIRNLATALRKFPSQFNDEFYKMSYTPFLQTLASLKDIFANIPIKHSDNIEKGTGIGGGTCHGHSLAIHSNVPVGEESVRVSCFLQSAYFLSKSFLNTNFQEAGKAVLLKPEAYPQVINKAAIVLGVKKEDKEQFLKDMQNADSPLRKNTDQTQWEIFLGRLVTNEIAIIDRSFLEKYNEKIAQEKDLEILNKHLTKLIEQEKLSPTAEGAEEISQIEQIVRGRQNELAELQIEINKLTFEHNKLENIINIAPVKSVSAKIMKRRRLEMETPLFKEEPISKLRSSLNTVANLPRTENGGKYNLRLHAPENSKLAGHAIALNFDKLTFSDINDCSLLTGTPKLRQFTSTGEMLTALSLLLKTVYDPGDYSSFSLIPVTTLP